MDVTHFLIEARMALKLLSKIVCRIASRSFVCCVFIKGNVHKICVCDCINSRKTSTSRNIRNDSVNGSTMKNASTCSYNSFSGILHARLLITPLCCVLRTTKPGSKWNDRRSSVFQLVVSMQWQLDSLVPESTTRLARPLKRVPLGRFTFWYMFLCRRRKREARDKHRNSQFAKNVRGIKAKLYNKKRYTEKAEMRKTYVRSTSNSVVIISTSYESECALCSPHVLALISIAVMLPCPMRSEWKWNDTLAKIHECCVESVSDFESHTFELFGCCSWYMEDV